jgi:hypothetical protein
VLLDITFKAFEDDEQVRGLIKKCGLADANPGCRCAWFSGRRVEGWFRGTQGCRDLEVSKWAGEVLLDIMFKAFEDDEQVRAVEGFRDLTALM